MPLQSLAVINSGDDRLHRAVKANGGDGVSETMEMQVGCYCFLATVLGMSLGSGDNRVDSYLDFINPTLVHHYTTI